jgi:membrane AbrB-like protein
MTRARNTPRGWPAWDNLGATGLTLGAAGLGGLVFSQFGLPGGILCGAMLAVGLLAMTRVRLRVPGPVRVAVFVALGTSMGSGLTPETLERARQWPVTLALLALSVVATMAASSWYLRRMHGWQADTARLSSVPGALTAVLLMAATVPGADYPRVALSQISRQVVLVALVPLVAGLGAAPAAAAIARATAGPFDLALLGVTGLAAGWLLKRAGLPAAMLLGSMLSSAVLHATGFASGGLPAPVQTVALVVVGAVVGVRLADVSLGVLAEAILPALGGVFIATLVAAAFALLAHALTGLPALEIWLAFAPGGVEAMTVLAYALNLDPSFVGVHHVVRLLGLMLLAPLWFQRAAPRIDTDRPAPKETMR